MPVRGWTIDLQKKRTWTVGEGETVKQQLNDEVKNNPSEKKDRLSALGRVANFT
jgi:hypothetical protein